MANESPRLPRPPKPPADSRWDKRKPLDIDAALGGCSIEEYIRLTDGLIYEANNALMTTIGFSKLALEELEPSHPAFARITTALKVTERAYALVHERALWMREARKRQTETSDTKL